MDKVIKVKLSYEGLGELKKFLEEYRDSLNDKCATLVKRLAQEGISVAEQNVGSFGKYLIFSVETEDPQADGCKAYAIAGESGKIISQWKTKEGTQSAEVSPLLLAEWGSGVRARPAETLENGMKVGQGTFPGQKHAFDKEGWYWQDLSDQWHHSDGVSPSMPMYHAYAGMKTKIREIAREVFGE